MGGGGLSLMLEGVSALEQAPIFVNEPSHRYLGKLTQFVQICYHKVGTMDLPIFTSLKGWSESYVSGCFSIKASSSFCKLTTPPISW
jgi:hypothetical protein